MNNLPRKICGIDRCLCPYYYRNVTPVFYRLFSQHPDEEALNCDCDKERYYNYFAFGASDLARNDDGRSPTQTNTIMIVTLCPLVSGSWDSGAYISGIECMGGDEFWLKRCEVLSACTEDSSAKELGGILKRANEIASKRDVTICVSGDDIVVSISGWKTDAIIPIDYFLSVLDVAHISLEVFALDGARSALCGELPNENCFQRAATKFLLSCADPSSYHEFDRLRSGLEERMQASIGAYGVPCALSLPAMKDMHEFCGQARRMAYADALEEAVRDFNLPF